MILLLGNGRILALEKAFLVETFAKAPQLFQS